MHLAHGEFGFSNWPLHIQTSVQPGALCRAGETIIFLLQTESSFTVISVHIVGQKLHFHLLRSAKIGSRLEAKMRVLAVRWINKAETRFVLKITSCDEMEFYSGISWYQWRWMYFLSSDLFLVDLVQLYSSSLCPSAPP